MFEQILRFIAALGKRLPDFWIGGESRIKVKTVI